MPNLSRRDEVADQPAQPAERVLGAECRGQPVRRLDAVLQRDDDGGGPDERSHGVGGRVHLPRLDPEQHDVHGADRRGIVGGVRRADDEVAFDAGHAQAGPTDSRQVLAAGDEGDILPRLGQPTAEIAPDRPASEHRDAHAASRRWTCDDGDADAVKVIESMAGVTSVRLG